MEKPTSMSKQSTPLKTKRGFRKSFARFSTSLRDHLLHSGNKNLDLTASESSVPADPKTEDPFYSPENHDFYSTFKYIELDPATDEIRLLRLLPSADDAVRCELIQPIRLDDTSEYTAISYCAGDPKHTKLIYVDGFAMNAFASLADVLQQIRRSSEAPEDTITVWADQICINQNNIDERASQVGKMRDIYKGASRTTVWLGLDYEDGLQVLQAIHHDVSLDLQSQSFLASEANLEVVRQDRDSDWNLVHTVVDRSLGYQVTTSNVLSIYIKSKAKRCFVVRQLLLGRFSMPLGGLEAGSTKKS